MKSPSNFVNEISAELIDLKHSDYARMFEKIHDDNEKSVSKALHQLSKALNLMYSALEYYIASTPNNSCAKDTLEQVQKIFNWED